MSDDDTNPGSVTLASIDRRLERIDDAVRGEEGMLVRMTALDARVEALDRRLLDCRSSSAEYRALVDRRLGGLAKGQAVAARPITLADLRRWWPLIVGLIVLLAGGGATALVRALSGGDVAQVIEAVRAEGRRNVQHIGADGGARRNHR